MEKKKTVNLDLKQYGMIFVLIVIYLIFAALTKGATLKPANINNLVMQNGYVVILATGMLLCCLTGNVDLGVGSLVALTGAVCGILLVDMGASMWIAILAALLTGLASGLFRHTTPRLRALRASPRRPEPASGAPHSPWPAATSDWTARCTWSR